MALNNNHPLNLFLFPIIHLLLPRFSTVCNYK